MSVENLTDEALLRDAEDALHSISLRLIGVSPRLSEPYTDAPEHSPWSLTIGPQARRAHDLAAAIRKHLGLPYRHPTRALGTPALEVEDVIAEAVAAEREECARQLVSQGCATAAALLREAPPVGQGGAR